MFVSKQAVVCWYKIHSAIIYSREAVRACVRDDFKVAWHCQFPIHYNTTTLLLEFDTLRVLKQLRSLPNDTL